jgi:hypothetical protein
MMLKLALVCDGTSDLCLVTLITWMMDEHYPDQLFRIVPAREVIPARDLLVQRLTRTVELYEPAVIFCHRDAENQALAHRVQEVETAAAFIAIPTIPLVPIRMLEAWLLFDEVAIRCAADNRNGTAALNLPALRHVEAQADPKHILYEALKDACGLPVRRKRRFNEHRARSMVMNHITDFSPLRTLAAFQRFEERFVAALHGLAT